MQQRQAHSYLITGFLLRSFISSHSDFCFLTNFAKIQNIMYDFLCFTQIMVISTLFIPFLLLLVEIFPEFFFWKQFKWLQLCSKERQSVQCSILCRIALWSNGIPSQLSIPVLPAPTFACPWFLSFDPSSYTHAHVTPTPSPSSSVTFL